MANPIRKRGLLVLKGMAMGAADVVPGVSGGTIAFITGIYEEFINTLKSINGTAFKKLFKEGIGSFWAHINGWFLLPLFLGIGISIASLASAITWLLEHHPVLVWAFFFGLIVASVWLISKSIKKWGVAPVVGLVAGTAIAYFITTLNTIADESANPFYILLCGSVAICAMILPGISGSFILLLMGAYELVIGTIKDTVDAVLHADFGTLGEKLKIVGMFGIGALGGLLAFSHVLSWLFKKFHDLTIAVLMGFLVGSLNKIWPWKTTITTYIKHPGEADQEVLPLAQENVLPWDYASISPAEAEQLGIAAKDPYTLAAVGLILAGVAVIWLLDRFGPKEA